MKPPIVEAFEQKIRKEAEHDFRNREKTSQPLDEIFGYLFCVFAIVWIGEWAIPIVVAELVFLSYIRTISNRVKEQEKNAVEVSDVEE